MSEKPKNNDRRTLLLQANRLPLAGTIGTAAGTSMFIGPAAATIANGESLKERTESSAEKVADVLEGPFGKHPGQRRNHTKGISAFGMFAGSPEATTLSRSLLFSGQTMAVIARFSIAGGNPNVPDADKRARASVSNSDFLTAVCNI
jgi:catalase